MKWTTSCASAASNSPSANGSSSAAARRTSTPGWRSRAAATNGSDGSTAATAAGPSRADQLGRQRTGPAADIQHPLAGADPGEIGEREASGIEYLPMNRSYASAATSKLTTGIYAFTGRWLKLGHALGIVIGVLVVLLAAPGRRDVQPARPATEPHAERLGAGRRPAPAPLRPDPEPRRDGQGLRLARARDLRGGHQGAHRGAAGQGVERAGAGRERAHRGDRAALRRGRGVPASCGRARTSSSSRRSSPRPSRRSRVARQVYNDTVLTYDNALQTVPTNIVAGLFNFEPREYFEVEEPRAREAPPRPVLSSPRRRRASLALAALVARRRGGGASPSRFPTRDVAVQIAARRRRSLVKEPITFAFDGAFSGAYRDIPLRERRVDRPTSPSARAASAYRPGASASSAASALPGHVRRRRASATACGSSGTTARPTSCARSRSATASAGSRSPTTTSSTST